MGPGPDLIRTDTLIRHVDPPKGEIEAPVFRQQIAGAGLDPVDTVIGQPSFATEHDDVAGFEQYSLCRITTLEPANPEPGIVAE